MQKSNKNFILYVEDEDIQSKIFSKIIEGEISQSGCKVVTFNNGADFIDLINSNHKKYNLAQFAVILLDLSVHDFSGFAMLKEALSKSLSTPIAVLSAREDKETKAKAYELGAKDYFVKGKDLQELDRLRSFLLKNLADK